jgi:hypothetical protein
MKTKFLILLMLAGTIPGLGLLKAQAPYNFNYQAIVRDGEGNALADQVVSIRVIILQGSPSGIVEYSESHTKSTNHEGLLTLAIGNGVLLSGSLSQINWSKGIYFLKIEVDPLGGTAFQEIGTTQLLSVPYALYAEKTNTDSKFEIRGNAQTPSDSALFEVKDKNGLPVFSVYENGVVVTTNDSTKGGRGGFVVGSRSAAKGKVNDILQLNSDSIRFYIRDVQAKGGRGGFAVGGKTAGKGNPQDFFSISAGQSAEIINPGQPQVLWYPMKNALLTGLVLVESPDSVGTNSFASGYESKAIGGWSQALGYHAKAAGQYSTAIGKNAVAFSDNSFAFGDNTKAVNTDAYAFGSGAIASGQGSYAFGSQGRNLAGNLTGNYTSASGTNSFAFGIGTSALGMGSVAIGSNSIASGDFATAIGLGCTASSIVGFASGFQCTASGNHSNTAMGEECTATGYAAFAAGWWAVANGNFSAALGQSVKTYGTSSMAFGAFTTANAPASMAIGKGNIGVSNSLFEIGNGSWNDLGGVPSGVKSNALTVLTSGKVGLGSAAPLANLEISVGGYDGYAGVAITSSIPNGKYITINQGTAGKLNFTIPGVVDLFTLDFTGSATPLRLSSGAYCSSGGAWTNASDRRLKENFADVDGDWLLSKIDELPVMTWNYRNETAGERHIGPMAQDFYSLFGFGIDTVTISTIDPAGISLAAIKELNRRNKSIKEEIALLKKDNENLQSAAVTATINTSQIMELQKQIKKLTEENIELRKTIESLSGLQSQIDEIRKSKVSN